MSIEKLQKEYEISVKWRTYPLHPETPEEGIPLTQLFAGRPADIPKMMGRLNKAAAELELPFNEIVTTYNSRLCQELGLWAESKDSGDDFHAAAFRAYFVDRKNIGTLPVLLDLAASVNLPVEEAAQVLTERTFKAAVDLDWALSQEKEIQVVPTYVVNRDKLVGVKPYKSLARFLEANGATLKGKR